jgi:hypothetical protein
LDQRPNPLQPKVELPVGREVVFRAEALAAVQAETRKRHLAGIVPEGNTAQARNAVSRVMDQEAVQVVVTPTESMLKDLMEFGQTRLVSLATSNRRHTSGLTPRSTTRS